MRFVIPAGAYRLWMRRGNCSGDPAALAAFTQALEETVYATDKRRLIKTPYHINDPRFAQAVAEQFRHIVGGE